VISILILTKNEEVNIAGCLQSVAWSDDITVLDSLSQDRTVELARAKGAKVVERAFDDWSSHQNWANKNIHFKHPWVFYLDADERMTSGLREEIERIASGSVPGTVAYYCGRRNYFMGRWIKHSFPPSAVMRFFQPSKVQFQRLVNPTAVVDGGHGYLREYLDHYNFSKGYSEWFDKHNRYSQWEAVEGAKELERGWSLAPLWSADRAARRQGLKRLAFKMPLRPVLKFLYLYLVKLGIFDGYPGLVYCSLQAIYEFQIDLKMAEISGKKP
jgi:glycosyltransferase involved in cell wall biosynthesis